MSLFYPFCQSFSVEAPYILHALPSQPAFGFLSQRQNKLCHHLDIMDYFYGFGQGKTSNKPISRSMLVIPHPVCYEWSHTILLVQGKAAEV